MNATMPKIRLPAEGELFDGKYRIGRVLGIGGMAAVIAARHLGLDEMVALKVLLPDCCTDPTVVSRFLQEGKAATKIRSEHVVRMLDVGIVSDRAYLVMEYLDGKDLEALVRKRGPLPLDEAVDLLLQACEAIAEAHALGIIHRDLKPANLFLTHRADGSPCVKVLDFGISKMPRKGRAAASPENRPTLPSLVMGSPQYMSPEQMSSAAMADQRSDIWSLGTILYELLAGEIAFNGATTAEICARVLRGSPAPLEEVRPEIPREVGLILARCLERDRPRRYATVAELARALAPFGTSSAHASAETISRVVEGATDVRAPLRSGPGTIKPTAAEILATVPKGRGRISGYVIAAAVAIGAIAVGAKELRHVVELHRDVVDPSAALAPPMPGTTPVLSPAVDAVPVSGGVVEASVAAVTPASTASAPEVVAVATPVPPPPARRNHKRRHFAARGPTPAATPVLEAAPAADVQPDDGNPYDSL